MVELVDLVILLLATARITILFVYDDITAGLRNVIFHYSPPEDNPDRGFWYQHLWKDSKEAKRRKLAAGANRLAAGWAYHEEKRGVGFVGAALSCPDCTGVWVGIVVALAYVLRPEETVTVGFVFAAAMAASWIARKGRFS